MDVLPRNEQGFTLLEVMCATAVLTIGMLGVYNAEIASARAYQDSRQVAIATSLASNMIEMLKIMPPSNVQALKNSNFARSFDETGAPVQNGQSASFFKLTVGPSAINGAQAFVVRIFWPDATKAGGQASLQIAGAPL